MFMDKDKIFQAVKKRYPEAALKNCYEAIANGKSAAQTEIHGFVVDDLYFIDSRTMEIFYTSDFFLVENIEEVLSD